MSLVEPRDFDYLDRTIHADLFTAVRSGRLSHTRRTWISGEPGQYFDLTRVVKAVPAGADIMRTHANPGNGMVLCAGADFVAVLEGMGEDMVVEVAASTHATARKVSRIIAKRVEYHSPPSSNFGMLLWAGRDEPSTMELDRVEWSEIRSNYEGATRDHLDLLTSIGPDAPGSGKVIVFSGAPGTGKSYSLLALMTSWRSWARPELLLDPREVLSDIRSMREVLGRRANGGMTRLVVCEDAGNLVSSTSTSRSEFLERLLNLTDGIAGIQQNLIVAITTNAELADIDEALLRPGRCLAAVRFAPFSADEARRRLRGCDAVVDGPMSLAEVLAVQGGLVHMRSKLSAFSTGTYL